MPAAEPARISPRACAMPPQRAACSISEAPTCTVGPSRPIEAPRARPSDGQAGSCRPTSLSDRKLAAVGVVAQMARRDRLRNAAALRAGEIGHARARRTGTKPQRGQEQRQRRLPAVRTAGVMERKTALRESASRAKTDADQADADGARPEHQPRLPDAAAIVHMRARAAQHRMGLRQLATLETPLAVSAHQAPGVGFVNGQIRRRRLAGPHAGS